MKINSNNNLRANILLLCITLFLCILIGELLLRSLKQPSNNNRNENGETIYLMSENFHHDYRPNQTFFKYPNNYDDFPPIKNEINSFAIRGPEIHPKRNNEYRVLLLGDSFLESEEVQYEETVGQVLENIVDNKNFVVIQHGMSSWSPLLELNWFNKKGIKLKPDIVILFLCINDFYSNYLRSDIHYEKETIFNDEGFPERFDIKIPLNQTKTRNVKYYYLYDLLERRFLLFDLLKNNINKLLKPKTNSLDQETINHLLINDFDNFANYLEKILSDNSENIDIINDILRLAKPIDLWDSETKNSVETSLGYVDRFVNLAKQNGIDIAITIVPFGWNISLEEEKIARRAYNFQDVIIPMGGIHNKILTYCKINQVQYIDLYESFKKYKINSNEKLFLIADGHWSPKGHEIVAKTINNIIFYNMEFQNNEIK